MLKKIVLCSLFLSSAAFAESTTGEEEKCANAESIMKRMEETLLPSDRDSCEDNFDCTFIQEHNWQQGEGINLKTAFAYDFLKSNARYKAQQKIADKNCHHMHPMVIFQAPLYAYCSKDKKCEIIINN